MESIANYTESIKALKSAILSSRYKAATSVNKELLLLYFTVGKFISEKVETEQWGAKVIDNLSNDLQSELPGLRGFSTTNIKRMRFFFESWKEHILISPSLTGQLQNIDIEQIVEFSFRDFNKAMGVSTYKTSATLPKAFKGLIPDAETFKKLMD